jgi:hypothetical protein
MSRSVRGLSAALLVTASPALAWAQAVVEPHQPQQPQQQQPPQPRAKGDVTLSLVAPTTRGAWTVRVTNEGDVPVRIAADARVLALDVTPRGARAPVRCELPEDMRPEGDLERPLVLPPGRSYAETFEARLYCFGEKKAAALAPGSIVVAHLGWTGKRPSSFEVSPIEGVEPHAAPRGAIDAPPVVLPDEPTAPASAPATGAGAPEGSAALSLAAASWVDAESASSVELPVTLRNDGRHAVAVRYRPEFLRFDVVGPDGVESCAWPVLPGAPTREQFTTLSPKADSQLVAALTAYCSSHAFDEPGLLVVRARVDTRQSSGALVGLRAFEGELVAPAPTFARLHRGRAPRPQPRPKLEGQ